MMPEVADGARSVILEQVTYGVAVRMAVLYLLGGGVAEEPHGGTGSRPGGDRSGGETRA
jgi:hypothetical protein